MFERFTDRARLAFVAAHDEVRARGASELGTEHVLLGLLHDPSSDAGRAFAGLGVSLESVRPRLIGTRAVTEARDGVVISVPVKKLLERSLREALRLGANRIGTGHLALAIADVLDGEARRVLVELGVERDVLRTRVGRALEVSVEAQEGRPVKPMVVPLLTPQTEQLLRSAMRFGSTYVAGRYLPMRMARGASQTARVVRRLATNQDAAAVAPGASSPATGLVPAACSVCGTRSPACGTLYAVDGSALVCEHCVDGAS